MEGFTKYVEVKIAKVEVFQACKEKVILEVMPSYLDLTLQVTRVLCFQRLALATLFVVNHSTCNIFKALMCYLS